MEKPHPSRCTGTASAGQRAAGSDGPGCPASRSSLCPSATASGLVGGRGEEEGQCQQCGGKQLAARCWRRQEKSILIALHAAPLEKGSRQRGYRGVGTKAVSTWRGDTQGRVALGGEAFPHRAPTPLGRHSLTSLSCQSCSSSNQGPKHPTFASATLTEKRLEKGAPFLQQTQLPRAPAAKPLLPPPSLVPQLHRGGFPSPPTGG